MNIIESFGEYLQVGDYIKFRGVDGDTWILEEIHFNGDYNKSQCVLSNTFRFKTAHPSNLERA